MKRNKIFIIAEIGINHNGSISLAKKSIDMAKKAGADADAEKKVKASGQLKKEGKNYVVQSGDVMHFKFNN